MKFYFCQRYERDEEDLIRNSREDSLVDQFKGTPPLSHIESPHGNIFLLLTKSSINNKINLFVVN